MERRRAIVINSSAGLLACRGRVNPVDRAARHPVISGALVPQRGERTSPAEQVNRRHRLVIFDLVLLRGR